LPFSLFQKGKVRKIKSIHLLLTAVLLTVATVWAGAAAQGVEQALVSIAFEALLKGCKSNNQSLPEYHQLCLAG
jgi:hypothetical protein